MALQMQQGETGDVTERVDFTRSRAAITREPALHVVERRFEMYTCPVVPVRAIRRQTVVHGGRRYRRRSPVGGAIVLEELPVDVLAGVEPGDDRIHDACRTVDDVERRVETMLGLLPVGDVERVFVADPSGVDAVHVNPVGVVLRS